MTNLKLKMEEIAKKYGFEIGATDTRIILFAKNTDGNTVKWFSYHTDEDSIYILGNTDSLNIWLYETRKDLSPEDCINFTNEINQLLDSNIKLRQLIDPEDWQEIACVSNAYDDVRYHSL